MQEPPNCTLTTQQYSDSSKVRAAWSTFLPLPAKHDATCLEYPFGQLASPVPVVSTLNSLCTPNLLTGEVRSRKGLGSVQALPSNNKNIPVLSTLFSAKHTEHSPMQTPMKKFSSIPAEITA